MGRTPPMLTFPLAVALCLLTNSLHSGFCQKCNNPRALQGVQSLAGVEVLLFFGCGFIFLSSFYLMHSICNQKIRNMISLCLRKNTGHLYSWDTQTKTYMTNILNADEHKSIPTCLGATLSLNHSIQSKRYQTSISRTECVFWIIFHSSQTAKWKDRSRQCNSQV